MVRWNWEGFFYTTKRKYAWALPIATYIHYIDTRNKENLSDLKERGNCGEILVIIRFREELSVVMDDSQNDIEFVTDYDNLSWS